MKYALGSLLFAGALALSFGAVRADVLVLTSSALKDNDQLAVKNACADKQRSPNCVGENISPPLAWSGAPEGTKSFAIVMLDPEGRAPVRAAAGERDDVIVVVAGAGSARLPGGGAGMLALKFPCHLTGSNAVETLNFTQFWAPLE